MQNIKCYYKDCNKPFYKIMGKIPLCKPHYEEKLSILKSGREKLKEQRLLKKDKKKTKEEEIQESMEELENLFQDFKKEIKPEPPHTEIGIEESELDAEITEPDEPKNIHKEEPKGTPQQKPPKTEMTYKDRNGTILRRNTMMPVSEIKLNNRLLTKLVYLGWAVLIYIIAMTVYIIYNDVFNNTLRAFTGC